MKQLPSAYLRRFTYRHDRAQRRINSNLIRLVGADRVVLGSDYCFDMGLTIRWAMGRLPRQSVLDRRADAVRLLRLESSERSV